MTQAKEWSGSQHPDAPDRYWLDDETGEAVCAHCSERGTTIAAIRHTGAMGKRCPALERETC